MKLFRVWRLTLSFAGLSEKLLHGQVDLDEVIEALFKEISTLDGAAQLQDSQVYQPQLKSTEALTDHVLFIFLCLMWLSRRHNIFLLFMLTNSFHWNLVIMLRYWIKKIIIFVVGGNRHTVVELDCDQTCWLNYYRRAKGQRSICLSLSGLSFCLSINGSGCQSVCLSVFCHYLFRNILTKESFKVYPQMFSQMSIIWYTTNSCFSASCGMQTSVFMRA